MTPAPIELLERLAQHAADAPDRVAIREIATNRSVTYAQLQADVTDLAATLRASFTPGSVVMLRAPNIARFHAGFLAAFAAEMTVFPIPCGIVDAELRALITKSSAAGIINEKSIDTFDEAARNDNAPALLLQSSGTTGLPKIVRREAVSVDAVSLQMVEAIGIEATDQILSCIPLCHSYGLEHGLLVPIWAGATIHLAHGFDLEQVRRELAASNITVFPSVPSIYEMLANLHDASVRLPKLRTAYSAGGPLPASVFEKLRNRCGITVTQLYGATEVGSITFARAADPHFDPASVGCAMRDVELRLNADQQLLVRAKSMMSGYVDDASPLTADGFLPTGDMARIDEHHNLTITGRLKFLIDVGGLKVNPMEVEQAICEHPAVSACVVVPVRLSETVSRLKAIVTATDVAHPPSVETLRSFAKERLSSFKIPRLFEVRDSLPRSATGKILRHLLLETP